MDLSFDRKLAIAGLVLGILALLTGLGVALAMDVKTRGEFFFVITMFGLSALLLTLVLGGSLWISELSGLTRLTSSVVLFGIIWTFFFSSVSWVNGRRGGDPQEPFSIAAISALSSQSSEQFTPFWAVFTEGWKSPLSAFVNFRVVNLQNIPVKIVQFTIEVNTSKGWMKVARINSQECQLFYATSSNLSDVVSIRAEMLDVKMEEATLSPHETVEGWLAIVYPRLNPPENLESHYRITVMDSAGAKSVVETAKIPVGDLEGQNSARFVAA